MTSDPVELLLEKLCGGDDAAAAEVFRTYEPYLRKVVRRQLTPQLRTKFDSTDIVQSVWVDMLRGFRTSGRRFPSAGHLRAFLVRATHNRFIDRLRQQRGALEGQQVVENLDVGASSPEPRPSEVAQANDLWDRMLALCPPAHRQVLQLKREGLTLAEIGARAGLHPDSVRRILRDLARELAVRPVGTEA
jgi:RNA polymerase sigma-70 factor (ECF subfamily)